jgi:hypothetical protein
MDKNEVRELISRYGTDPALSRMRLELSYFAAEVFNDAGQELHVVGHVLGSDRVTGASPFGNGTDETVGISAILRIGGDLIFSATRLFELKHAYSAAALLRQLVEVEYLAWAFEHRKNDAQLWLRSDRNVREDFFRPAKLRAAANNRFRGVDYSYHCELGGHPVPGGLMLLAQSHDGFDQLLLSDLLGHVGRIWDHIVGWAKQSQHGESIRTRSLRMSERFRDWKSADRLVDLPPP